MKWDLKYNPLAFGLAAVLILLFTWRLAFSRTWELYQDNNRLRTQIEQAQHMPQGYQQLQKELAMMNEKIRRYSSTKSNQEQIVAYASRYANENALKVIEIPKVSTEKEKGFAIETNTLKVQGDYKDIVRLIYQLEQKEHLCHVVSTDFQRIQNMKTHQQYLVATLYLQNINKEQS